MKVLPSLLQNAAISKLILITLKSDEDFYN